MSNYLNKIVYLTDEQYDTLTNIGSININGQTQSYSANTLYVTNTNLITASPSASGTATSFITEISQDKNGKISASKADLNILNNTSAGALGWDSGGNTNANNLRLVNVNTITYWNGAYSGTNSNLAYCNKGAFGTIITNNFPTVDASTKYLRGNGDWVTLSDMGLSTAMHYKGAVEAAPTTTTPTGTYSAGDVVTYSNSEYVYDGENWRELGSENSFKLIQTAVSTSTATGSSATTFVSSVTQDTQGVITVETSTLDTSGTWSGTATTATNLAAAPTITEAGSSGTTLSAETFYTLTVGGQSIIFKTPTDTQNSAYGNISTSGTVSQSSGWSLGSGDALVVADSNASWKLERTGITFDASTETECLTKKGTWASFTNNTGTVTSITIKTSSPLTGGSNTATTTSGEYTIGFSNQNVNTVLAGPSTGSNAGAPSFRALVAADITAITTASDTSNQLYVLGVTSSATTTVKYNTGVKMTNGAVSATTYNGLTLSKETIGFKIGGGTTSKTLTVADTATINAPTQWGIVYGGASGAYTSTAAGTSGQYLKSNGNAAPTWATFSNATVGLGNVTNHQQVNAVTWDNTGKKITKTKDATTTDVVTFAAGTNITLGATSTTLTINAANQRVEIISFS